VIKPRSAILDLLSPRGRRPISAAAIVEACALFGISSNNTRVALARLVADGRLDKLGPASYALSEDAEYFNRRVLGWSQLDKLDKGWNTKWTMVHLQSPPSTRVREYARRAYRFARVAEVNPTLAVRPDNLRLDHYDLRDTLITFGLDGPFFVSCADVDDYVAEQWVLHLWHTDRLRAAHNRMAARLEASLVRLGRLPFEKALVESFIVGGEAIRALVLDPLLPEIFMPGRERNFVLKLMRAYDQVGRALWRQFNERFEDSPKVEFAPFQSALAENGMAPSPQR
jgi:phenylacetic acid degradation operon negative regulatory protein